MPSSYLWDLTGNGSVNCKTRVKSPCEILRSATTTTALCCRSNISPKASNSKELGINNKIRVTLDLTLLQCRDDSSFPQIQGGRYQEEEEDEFKSFSQCCHS